MYKVLTPSLKRQFKKKKSAIYSFAEINERDVPPKKKNYNQGWHEEQSMIYCGRKNPMTVTAGPSNLTQEKDERTHLASTIRQCQHALSVKNAHSLYKLS